MKKLALILSFVTVTPSALAYSFSCVESPSLSDSDKYRVEVSNDWSSASVFVNHKLATFGSLRCTSGRGEKILNCHSTNVSDAGYSVSFYYNADRWGVTYTANLSEITFIGSRPVATLQCGNDK